MGESYEYNHQHQHQLQLHQNQNLQQQPSGSSRMGIRSTGGEIVEVQGGHIVRSTGRKDRHSKVCTAKGPRDRRVRLSAHTAIQFYDVQDRLGYDRPSKAVDWLIKKAKTAIDELAELPAWKPTATNPKQQVTDYDNNENGLGGFERHPDDNIVDNQMGGSQNSSFLPASLDSDSIADTIKSFFPMGGASNHHPSSHQNDSVSSGGVQFRNQSQDLRLSLQSIQDPHPILQHQQSSEQPGGNDDGNVYFDGSGWPEAQPGGFQRMVAWGGVGVGVGVGSGEVVSNSTGFVFGSQQQSTPFLQPLFGHQTASSNNNNQLFNNSSQRGPLQSSTAPSFRAWIDPPQPPSFAGVSVDQHPTLAFHHPSSIPGFASGLGGFSGFRVPARIQGQEEQHDGISDRPSSASSDSHH